MELKRNDNKSDDEKIRVWIAKNIIYCKKYDLFFSNKTLKEEKISAVKEIYEIESI